MLQNPVNDVLIPLPVNAAQVFDGPQIAVSGVPDVPVSKWADLGEVVLSNGVSELPLKEFLSALNKPVPADATYQEAQELCAGDQTSQASGKFLVAALNDDNRVASLYGLAYALQKAKRNARAEKLAAFLAQTPGVTHPQPYALAGYAAFNRKAIKQTRTHLAKAARLARASESYRPLQKFAQRVLLIQEFGAGGSD